MCLRLSFLTCKIEMIIVISQIFCEAQIRERIHSAMKTVKYETNRGC